MRGNKRDEHPGPPRGFVDPVRYAQRAMREEVRALLDLVDSEFRAREKS